MSWLEQEAAASERPKEEGRPADPIVSHARANAHTSPVQARRDGLAEWKVRFLGGNFLRRQCSAREYAARSEALGVVSPRSIERAAPSPKCAAVGQGRAHARFKRAPPI